MGGRSSWLLVALVATIGIVAAADALRGGRGEPEARPPETTTAPETMTSSERERPTDEPPEGGPSGVLYYTDARCELRAVRLPGLEAVAAPGWDDCRFVLSPDGSRASPEGSGWDPHSDPRIGRLFQTQDGGVLVASNGGPEGEPVRGAAPAWRPDGTFTYFADGAIRAWPGGSEILSQRRLLGAIRANPSVPDGRRFLRVRAREVAWLDDERLAAILSAEVRAAADEDLFAVYEGRRLVQLFFGERGEFSGLRASARGALVALRSRTGLLLLDRFGNRLETPELAGFRAIAFSPDERWAAVATQAGVHVFRAGAADLETRELPIVASDLAWRGPAGRGGADVVRGSPEAREWLGSVSATGRLFLTEPGCRLRALRLPDLVWEEEPSQPSRCRFVLGFADRPLEEGIAVRPQGDRAARCTADGVEVIALEDDEVVARHPDACAPIWSPFGSLAFIRGGELVEADAPGGEGRVIVSRRALRSMFGAGAMLVEAAWIDDRRLWAVVRLGNDAVLAAMTTDRLVFQPSFAARRIEELRVSATGMVAARTDRGVVVFDAGGRRALTFPDGRAAAWAPGELILAISTGSQILFVAPVSREVVSLAVRAEDLEWVVP